MNQSFDIVQSLLRGTFLLVALLLSGCDSNSFDDEDDLTGVWTATATVDWSKTYVLPAGAAVDSVHYLHVGTHRVLFGITQADGVVDGTVDWDVDGVFVETKYADGVSATEVDDVDRNRDPETAGGHFDAPTLTVRRSGTTNDWLSPLDAVEFTLHDDALRGQLVYRYLVTEWATPNGSFTTTFEVPVSLRLDRMSEALPR